LLSRMKAFVKTRPRLYKKLDWLFPIRTDTERWMDRFSRNLGRPASFIQIGANDSMRNDPIRRFIIRDGWEGILVEPVTPIFNLLKKNYAFLKERKLIFVNAAVSDRAGENITFWAYTQGFLETLSDKERIQSMERSSLDRQHLLNYLTDYTETDDKVEGFPVPVFTVDGLVGKYWNGVMPDVVAIDAEGHDDSVIMGIDLRKHRPRLILYEWHHLGDKDNSLRRHLEEHGYEVSKIEGDAVAVLR